MPAKTQKKILVADTEEELEAMVTQGEATLGDPEHEHPPEPEHEHPHEPGHHESPEPEESDEESEEDEEAEAPEDVAGVVYPALSDGLAALDGEVLTNTVRYEARISIVEAWQYNGNVRQAPPWVDRNWIGYADFDPLRDIQAGPCLRFPSATGEMVIVRIGDYLAQQDVKLADGLSDIRIEVWEKSHFEKLFIPKTHRIGA